MKPLVAKPATANGQGPSFSLGNRLWRATWMALWALLAGWTPPPLHRWRALLLRICGAKLGRGVRVYGSARIWDPRHLQVGDFSTLGPRVNCYNQGSITIAERVTVSQGAHLCASSHDTSDPHFQLILRPIHIEAWAWIAAEAFVGPGVRVGEGAVLGARGVAMRDLEPWSIYTGNPAEYLRARAWNGDMRRQGAAAD